MKPKIQMQNTGRKILRREIRCGLIVIAMGLLFASDGAAQMLQPDRNGWGDSRSVETPTNDWLYSQSSQSIPVDRIPSEEIRNQIGLASFEQAVAVKEGLRLAEVGQGRIAGSTLPPRDAMTDPFLKLASQRETDDSPMEPAAGSLGDVQNDSTAQPAGYFMAGTAGESVTVEQAQSSRAEPFDFSSLSDVFSGGDSALPREGLGSSIKAMLLLATLSLAPAIVLMTTSYVRVVVVLSLLRQAFGSQQLPPTQVITALSLFLTMLVMAPVWNEVKTEAIDPYAAADSDVTWQSAWDAGVKPVRRFMQKQIQLAGNEQSIATFYRYLPETSQQPPESFDDVPLNVLLPAFMVSELKVAFLLGFQVFLPFLVLDLVVSSVTVSMGMLMLPPSMVSFPLKLILFVMVDGWNLVIGMLLQSFGPFV